MTIKETRVKMGMSQSDVSRRLGIPKRTLENWEEGHRKCPDYLEHLISDRLLFDFKEDSIGFDGKIYRISESEELFREVIKHFCY